MNAGLSAPSVPSRSVPPTPDRKALSKSAQTQTTKLDEQPVYPQTVKRKLLVVGDDNVGQTDLLLAFSMGNPFQDRIPRFYDHSSTTCKVDGKKLELPIWSISGMEDYDQLRAQLYPKTHAVNICFAVDSSSSLRNVWAKWAPKVANSCEDILTFLVNTE